MSFFTMMQTAGTGLSAQNERLNIIASNMANADTLAGSEKTAYKSRQPVFQTLYSNVFDQSSNPGVSMVGVIESQAIHDKEYSPDNPLADENGYVYRSNVDGIAEMTNMMVATRTYQNTVEVMKTSRDLLLATLKMGQ